MKDSYGGLRMLMDVSRTGMKPVLLRGGQDEVAIEKIEYHQPEPVKLDEEWYQKLLHRHPDLLLANKFDFEYEPISIGMEYVTTHGKYIDNLFVTRDGKIVLVEDKLIRNATSRSVIAQAIDYAQDMQKWSYEDLDEAFRKQKLGSSGEGLFEYINRLSGGNVERSEFAGSISRNLKTASFLILIAGDKIHVETENMADFLNRYTTMNFRIGLLELEVYITADGDWIVVPYLTTKTQVVERLYVRVENADRSEAQLVEARPVEEKAPEAVTKKERKIYLSKNALSDEELYSLIEGQGKENLNTELREGIQGIIDDVRNNQLDGYSVKRTDRSFAIHLESTFLVRSSSVLVISVNEARFFKTVLQGTLLTSGLDPETADRLVDEYVSFLETALYARTGKCDVVISNLSLLASKRAELFAELQGLARAIDDAMRRV